MRKNLSQWIIIATLSRSLLDRVYRAGRGLDRSGVEGIIHEVADVHIRPVIEWMDSAATIYHRLLLATWETPDQPVCVPNHAAA